MHHHRKTTRSASFVLVFAVMALLVTGCNADALTGGGDGTGSISVYNGGNTSRDVLIDGALAAALAPHEKKVLTGYAPGKYLVQIKPCSAAAVTVSAGNTSGLECYGT